MKKKMIKLINSERVNTKVTSQKAIGCDLGSFDVCSVKDLAGCTVNSYDNCGKDYAVCYNNSYDLCYTEDKIACFDGGHDVE